MFKYLMKTDKGDMLEVEFRNPVSKDDVIYTPIWPDSEIRKYLVTSVCHMNYGGSTIICDNMDV